jgi:hypothetical protein
MEDARFTHLETLGQSLADLESRRGMHLYLAV